MVSPARPTRQVVAELRREVERIQGAPIRAEVPVHPALRGLVDVRAGGIYSVETASLALLLVAGPSAQKSWCGIVGVPDLGVEAAAAMGVDLSRTVVVPEPGDRWLDVTAALVDVLALVVVRPPTTSALTAGDASRLAARLRSRGSVLVPWGQWPGADAQLTMTGPRWKGVGRGHGHLRSRQVTVTVRRGTAPARTRSLWLPAADRVVRAVEEPVGQLPARSA